MSLNDTPSANRLHIGFFGCRNAGKSSLVNAVTGQELSVVSDTKGTTTDPVTKAMELLPLGPVVIIDTPGFDDTGELGEKRVHKTKQILNKTDIAVLVVDGTAGLHECDKQLLDIFRKKGVPYLIVYNKSDLTPLQTPLEENSLAVSSLTKEGIHELKEAIGHLLKDRAADAVLVGDLIRPKETVVLVTPIDESAPKGRMILPQQQMLRDVLDADAVAVVTKETELKETLEALKAPPAMVITDSQAFKVVSEIVPDSVPLTSFSILMARYKGFLETAVKGIAAARRLTDGDTVLIAEGCTHHRQCNDIGTVKIPRWLKEYTQKDLHIETCSGTEFPEDLSPYALVIHCGGCMLNGREVTSRMSLAVEQGVPFTNYGIFIAAATGTLERSIRLFPQLHRLLCE